MINRTKAALAMLTFTAMLTTAGCAPHEADESSSANEGKQPAITVEFSMDAECSICHATEKASSENAACLASKHKSATCTTCHDDESSMVEAHKDATVDGKMPKKLKKTEVNVATCSSCHADSERISATADNTACTDSKGTVVNPHDLPDNEDHRKIVCSDCHKEHAAEPIEETAKKECISCHHADVFECHTCHE